MLLLTAILLPVLLITTSFAVDLGRQRAARRDMQAKADVISLDLARLINGGRAVDIDYNPTLTAAAARNGVALSKIKTPVWGTLNASTKKFEACVTIDCIPTAVKVTAEDSVSYFFQQGNGAVSRSAVGILDRQAGFSIGSFAAAVNSGDASSALVNSLIGDALNLSALSYSGLATSNLTFLGIANELGIGTPDQLFNSNVTAAQFLLASADILRRSEGNSARVQALDAAVAVPALSGISVGQMFKVQPGSEAAALGSTFNVLDALSGAAFVANGSAGLAVPNVTVGLPGLTLTGNATLTQAPQTVYGTIGDYADTSQISLNMTSSSAPVSVPNQTVSYLNGLFPTLGLQSLLCGGLLGALLNLCLLGTKVVSLTVSATANAQLAAARGTIAGINCGTTTKALDIDVASELSSTTVTFNVVVHIAGVPDKPVTISASTGRPATNNGYADFVIPTPDPMDVFKHAEPPVGSLSLSSTQLQTNALGSLGNLLVSSLNTALSTTVSGLNSAIVSPLSGLLGLRVASADVAPRAVSCNSVKLAG